MKNQKDLEKEILLEMKKSLRMMEQDLLRQVKGSKPVIKMKQNPDGVWEAEDKKKK